MPKPISLRGQLLTGSKSLSKPSRNSWRRILRWCIRRLKTCAFCTPTSNQFSLSNGEHPMAIWGRDWVRLYKHPSPSWLALPHSTRGLGYEMLRVCDEHGRIECKGSDPLEVVLCVCAIHGQGRRLASQDYARLKADGFFTIEGSAIVIPNYHKAQVAQSPAAAKKAEQRARAAQEQTSGQPPTDEQPVSNLQQPVSNLQQSVSKTRKSVGVGANPAESLDPNGDSPPKRREEKRQEERGEEDAREEGKDTPPPTKVLVSQQTPPPAEPVRLSVPLVEPANPDEGRQSSEMAKAIRIKDLMDSHSGGVLSSLALAPADLYKLGSIAEQLAKTHGITPADWVTLAEWLAPSGPGLKDSKSKQFAPSWRALIGRDGGGAWLRECMKKAIEWREGGKNTGGYLGR